MCQSGTLLVVYQGPDLQNIIRQSYDDDRSYDKSYD